VSGERRQSRREGGDGGGKPEAREIRAEQQSFVFLLVDGGTQPLRVGRRQWWELK
jgi:hypothetical protein